ncbi:MAG TPA: nucleotide sugar dehydrogenase [Solirubrobacteraceae bacterium]|jgi:UDPglucose 6-dehydrogenase|nr:nucleotide sugar dehydrogenase [Solirubrobacteraceae bacterium]
MRDVDVDRGEPIGVVGLWHLGSVTAACLADAGNHVIGVDPDHEVIEGLIASRPPVSEPGLEELLERNASRLDFTCETDALAGARRAWVTFDTPVDDDDDADVEWVLEQASELLEQLPAGSLVVVSSQLPVGSIARLQERCAARRGDGGLRFACVPENLRLGRALESFRARDRIVAGVRSEEDRSELASLLAPFSASVQWMRVESAEMTKHALNGFLATSVAFINQVAEICESVGADAEEVSRGLKSEQRIGPGAYLGPGDAFAGGTLARDIGFLRGLAKRRGLPAHVFAGVADGNAAHKHWTRRKLLALLATDGHGDGHARDGVGDEDSRRQDALAGRRVAIWGLTYKPGTDTLRRSSAIELCRWLVAAGASVQAHDPAVSALPAELADRVELCSSALEAAGGANALVVCTAWPAYLEVPAEELLSVLAQAQVIDPAGVLQASLGARPDVRYVRVGTPTEMRVRRRSDAMLVTDAGATPVAEVER